MQCQLAFIKRLTVLSNGAKNERLVLTALRDESITSLRNKTISLK